MWTYHSLLIVYFLCDSVFSSTNQGQSPDNHFMNGYMSHMFTISLSELSDIWMMSINVSDFVLGCHHWWECLVISIYLWTYLEGATIDHAISKMTNLGDSGYQMVKKKARNWLMHRSISRRLLAWCTIQVDVPFKTMVSCALDSLTDEVLLHVTQGELSRLWKRQDKGGHFIKK